ncbi:Os01g0571700, partial [Oryza sativa Japonica Group]
FVEATGLETGETILFWMPSQSKACVMILNRQGLIRCPVKTPSNSSSANKRPLDPSGQLTRASTFDHASPSKSVPFLRNGTGSNKRKPSRHLLLPPD